MTSRRVPVWDAGVRILHWSLAVAVATAWLTRHRPGPAHEWLGYATLALVALRVTWGFGRSPYARFTQFVRSPHHTLQYAWNLAHGRQRRYLGHNPLGGWMAVALLVAVLATGVSGWLYTTDRFWGVEWVETLHSMLSDITWVLRRP